MEKIPIKIPNTTIVFSKPLGKNDRENQLTVPTGVLEMFPIEHGYERAFPAFDKHDEEWPFILGIRQTGDYHKPFLRRPKWHEFVEANGLSKNDGHEYGVIFYIKDEEPNKMQVRGLRRKPHAKLWGKPIWEEV